MVEQVCWTCDKSLQQRVNAPGSIGQIPTNVAIRSGSIEIKAVDAPNLLLPQLWRLFCRVVRHQTLFFLYFLMLRSGALNLCCYLKMICICINETTFYWKKSNTIKVLVRRTWLALKASNIWIHSVKIRWLLMCQCIAGLLAMLLSSEYLKLLSRKKCIH